MMQLPRFDAEKEERESPAPETPNPLGPATLTFKLTYDENVFLVHLS